eukprot:TRINITY_DN5246_c0_g1_i1.p1 TRINITY_DN5246_c0_g1~~TRINITY_DN5246_c0_g1_i1.p1  ORF type:complete len:220 (-),score=41.02 TRINITY_DN5246_c0_g1_i1:197-856(-)
MAVLHSKKRIVDLHPCSSIRNGEHENERRMESGDELVSNPTGPAKEQGNGNQDGVLKIDQLQLWNKGAGVIEASKDYAKRNLAYIKERLMVKLSAVPLPADALDNPRQSVEMIVKDVTHAAQGITKDAFLKIKARLAELLPSLSAIQSGKIVDDVEREVMDISKSPKSTFASKDEEKTSLDESDKQETRQEEISPTPKASFMSPASAFHFRRPFFRSRL